MPCPRTQANLPACSPYYSFCAECQAGKLWLPFFNVFLDMRNESQVYQLQRGISKILAILFDLKENCLNQVMGTVFFNLNSKALDFRL